MVTQVLALFRQPLDRPVFRRRHAKCRTRDLRRQDSEIPLFPNAALFPFIRQVLPYGDAPQPFVDPILRITFGLVNGLHAFLRQLRVLDLLHTLISDLCQPLLEWLGLRRGDRLDDTKQPFNIGSLNRPPATIGGDHRNWGTNCTPVAIKQGIALPHTLDILFDIYAVRQKFNDIGNGKYHCSFIHARRICLS